MSARIGQGNDGALVASLAYRIGYFLFGHSAAAESLSIFFGHLSEACVLLRSGARSGVACAVVDSSMGLVEKANEKQKHI